ncbi:flagellar filament capping protein FliD [Anaerocolumna sp. MB42-C2]|uniref:flagellar filament capping protein FliD n=1 Tax=Anaerocolumna sp. MB42-C2 TaxID=3070997 RepID=UPI0027DEFCC1|nr:flagellar filament capping protein FliD [Anaerocolumna sp. MB42-C2]WMJ90231.1 flagellar filament capping protein FliD [Anaerocolumna sp. MB42-C2]
MSTIRMTGLISNMDTESIIKELVSAQKMKNKKTSDKLTTSEWKEDKWKELNAKLVKLCMGTGGLSDLRLQGSYKTKKAASSNEDIVKVTGGASAPEGAHTLSISNLASSQYVTGGKLGTDKNGKTVTNDTTLADLDMAVGTTINVTSNGKTKSLVVTDKTTLNDFINTCTSAGLTANYDKTQNRLFISSKASGAANSFTITTDATSFNDIKNLTGYNGLNAEKQKEVSAALTTIKGISSSDLGDLYTKALNGTTGANEDEQKKIDALKTLQTYAVEKAKADKKEECIANVKETDVKSAILNSYTGTEDEKKTLAIKAEIKTQIEEQIAAGKLTLKDGETVDDLTTDKYNTYLDEERNIIFSQAINRKYASDPIYAADADTAYQTAITDPTFAENVLSTANTSGIYSKINSYLSNKTGDLSALGFGEITGDEVTAADPNAMSVVKASDASFVLDGASLTSSSNTLTVNGLTINIKSKTEPGKTVTLDVSNDTQATYDMIKNFIKSYNDILKEMNDLYYAGSSRGYDPLTDDEKEAMTDDQIEKWETKIKNSILRRDSTLGAVLDSMKTAIMSSVQVGDKKYSLSTFGIQTSTDYTEKGLLHIYGNKDDSTYSDKDDKLLKALNEDPDATIEALSGIFGKLYKTMNDNMSSIPNVRSKYNFYNDKLMDNEQTEYKKKVAVLEKKLTEMENKYYKQFSAMETALAKMQSQGNALSGLLGTSK